MEWLKNLLNSNSDLLGAAIVSVLVSSAISYFFRTRETRHRLQIEHEYEQRRKLRDLTARYHGRLLTAANSLNYRFWNLYANHEKGWLNVQGQWDQNHYYFLSSVYRFLNVCALVREFEKEAIFLDARIAEKRDFQFLQYLAALRWCMTAVELFDDLPYETFRETDHFFADTFRQYCDAYIQPNGEMLAFNAFVAQIQEDRSLDPVLHFFDSLRKSEDRLRWDRLVAFHLLLVAFINTIGYPEHRTPEQKIERIARQARNGETLRNLSSWLPRHGLKDRESRLISAVAMRVSKQVYGPPSAVPVQV